ncbi:MAG: hypothetical protein JNJ46_07055 [Myxococcales bacterium]|nr:hypothetical protein [Myxococcales bacterium]
MNLQPGRKDRRFMHRLLLLSVALCACAAGSVGDEASQPRRQPVESPDGDLTLRSAVRLNRYARLVADASVGASQLRVDSAELAAMGLVRGDLILVMQMQGAQIDTTASGPAAEAHGSVTQLAGAGRFELVPVEASNPASGLVTVSTLCGGLRGAYSVLGKSQIVRVPQHGELAIEAGGVLSAQPWDGNTGGIVAVRARHLRVASGGSLLADGTGFRGGVSRVPSGNKAPGSDSAAFAVTSLDEGAEKGEGIAGRLSTLGRGASANGGGGGNAYGSGGAGGANAGTAATWTGHGVMRLVGGGDALSWALDPVGSAGLSSASGGGRGGYSLSQNDQNATLLGPGDALWGGNSRRERGGRGGVPLSNNAAVRLFLGGGGGAGDRILAAPVAGNEGGGGRGGGLVYVLADVVDGDGLISARGEAGVSTQTGVIGGAGGGGGGGSIVLNTLSLSGSLQIVADGGTGGSQQRAGMAAFNNALGPGGGGGGGFIAVPQSRPPTTVQRAAGGAAGTSAADIITEFTQNGATAGGDGETSAALNPAGAATPICSPVDLRIAISDGIDHAAPDSEISYLISVYNDGPDTAVAAPVRGALSQRVDFVDWFCSVDPGPMGNAGLVGCNRALGINDLNTLVTLTPGAQARIVVRAILPSRLEGTLSYTASVAAASTQQDLDTSNNMASDSTQVGPEADLSVAAIVAPSPTKSGQSLSYILSVQNHGINDASDVKLSFQLPEQAVLSSTFPPRGDGWDCQVQAAAPQVVCTRPQLEFGAAPEVVVALQPLFNMAYAVGVAQVQSAAFDPDLGNNAATAVADIEYDITRYRRSVFAGGGLACSLSARHATVSSSALAWWGLLVGGILAVRRARRSLFARRCFSSASPAASPSAAPSSGLHPVHRCSRHLLP